MLSSRSKSTTCQRKGCLLRFKLNSIATSHGSAQKLGNDVGRDSESIATKVCSQICSKNERTIKKLKNCMATRRLPTSATTSPTMFASHAVTSLDRKCFYFQFDGFFSNLPWKTIIYCVTDQPSIAMIA